ncbi:uncharacterized protein HMPREF1541_07875 [Cyphellophora europaea CBS 101466]|uniref:Alpha/beta hydrolase fold-3 domain-containing protein n=1 Tax=Cyphellophora europaea (strain CBS 101466) TaxID=1220924 RepID=W2RMH6_CYPE1|nr:uncharacterized protein HMPREF1541_07875 [Cyphellophora europaea CBS 101466]ETN36888.1 hypothetical protein HMPREF1541_07875 [Cyphellophora europaea CBS 101466]
MVATATETRSSPPPQSAQAQLFHLFSRTLPASSSPTDLFTARALYDQLFTLATEVPGVSYRTTTIASRPALWVHPPPPTTSNTGSQTPTATNTLAPKTPTPAVILYLHGGGFSLGSPNSHRLISAHLSLHTHLRVLSLDYRLAPEHPYPAALDDAVAAYRALQTTYPSAKIVLAGDSCGGNLVLAVALRLQRDNSGAREPAAGVALSPWFDLTAQEREGGSFAENADGEKPRDEMSGRAAIAALVERYLRGTGVQAGQEALVSPLYATEEDLRALGGMPLWVSVGGWDALRDQGDGMVRRLEGAGADVVCERHEESLHIMEMQAGRAEAADESLRRIGAWVRGKLGLDVVKV